MFLNLLGRLSDSGTETASVSGHMLTHSRLVFDRETGKPRGYGFCEFSGVFHTLARKRLPFTQRRP